MPCVPQFVPVDTVGKLLVLKWCSICFQLNITRKVVVNVWSCAGLLWFVIF